MELYVERGFEQTTVADIAERAGLTARTFFRYFADKREVLFGGSDALQDGMVARARPAPGRRDADRGRRRRARRRRPQMLGGDRDFSRQRQAVIAANAELRERELIKMASLAAALADGAARARRRRARGQPGRRGRHRRVPRRLRALGDRGSRSAAGRGHARVARPAEDR